MTRKRSSGRIALLVLAVLAVAACVPPTPPLSITSEGALSVDQLLAGLDSLQAQSRSLTSAGQSVYASPAGSVISLQDLSTYVNAIKTGLAQFVTARTGGSPYLVVPVRLAGARSYPSVDANGSSLRLSGLVWVPFTWGKHLAAPIISIGHGTEVSRANAPSRFDPNPFAILAGADQFGAFQNYVECIVGGLMAAAGYIVVMPDYPGFGDSTVMHPYVHMSLGNSIRDIVRAATSLLAGGTVAPNGKVFVTGYSEGGYTAIAGSRALQDAGIRVTATVPADGSYDLSGVMLDQVLGSAPVKVPFYFLYAASGMKSVYGAALDYNTLFTPYYADLLGTTRIFDGNHTTAQVRSLVPDTVPRNMLASNAPADLLAPGEAVYNLLAANDSYRGWVADAPVIFIHAPLDDVVPYQNAVVARSAIIANGTPSALVPPITDVDPVPLIALALGEQHVAAFPTAMAAAFKAIDAVNSGH